MDDIKQLTTTITTLTTQLITMTNELNKCKDEKRDLEMEILNYKQRIERLQALLNPSSGSCSGGRRL